jgi:ketosteroid isomerase-like protein
MLKLQASESDFQAQLDLLHKDLLWQPVYFGSSEIGKEEFGKYLKAWQDQMEDVVYTADNWLPGVLPETGLADGSVRSYGKWSGTHTLTGKKWEMKAYHTWDFKDGLIVRGGDYFDATGLTNFLKAPTAE